MRPALIIGIGFLCFTLTGCLDKLGLGGPKGGEEGTLQAEANELRATVTELHDRKKELSKELSGKKKAVKDLDNLEEKEARLREESAPIARYVNGLKVADEYLESQLAVWKVATRDSLKGLAIGSFRTISGVEVANAVITEIGDEAVVIKFDGGEKPFEWKELPENLRIGLVHEPTVRLGGGI